MIQEAVDEAIACVNYDLIITKDTNPRTAQLVIDVRKQAERADEVAYWTEELREIPFVAASYRESRSPNGQQTIRFTLHEVVHTQP